MQVVSLQGLLACWDRHSGCSKQLYAGLQELGLQLLVSDEVSEL